MTDGDRFAIYVSTVIPLWIICMVGFIWYDSTRPTQDQIRADWPYTIPYYADKHVDQIKVWNGNKITGHSPCHDTWEYYPKDTWEGETTHASFSCDLYSGPHTYHIYTHMLYNGKWLTKADRDD